MSILINSYSYATGGSGFSPDDVAGLWMWLKADAIVGLNDGDPVTTWSDSHTTAHDATQSTLENKPIYKTNIVNGLPVVRFIVTAPPYLNLEDMSALTCGEIFIVFKLTADPSVLGGGLHQIGTHAGSSHHPFTNGVIYDAFGSTTRQTTVNPTPAMTSWRVYSAYSATNDWANYLDGMQLYNTATNIVGFTATPTLSTQPYPIDGDIAEVIMYDNKLSTENRANVIQYLSDKYNLGIS